MTNNFCYNINNLFYAEIFKKIMSERCAEHPFVGQYTQQQILFSNLKKEIKECVLQTNFVFTAWKIG